MTERTERADFQATSDPAVLEASDRGESHLLGYRELYCDEHRHVAFGARFLRDMAQRDPRHADAIQRTLAEVAPVADGVLRPKWFEGSDDEPLNLGASVAETRAFALKALERRMKVIGLVAAA